MQPLWLCSIPALCKGQWGKVKQMQPLWLYSIPILCKGTSHPFSLLLPCPLLAHPLNLTTSEFYIHLSFALSSRSLAISTSCPLPWSDVDILNFDTPAIFQIALIVNFAPFFLLPFLWPTFDVQIVSVSSFLVPTHFLLASLFSLPICAFSLSFLLCKCHFSLSLAFHSSSINYFFPTQSWHLASILRTRKLPHSFFLLTFLKLILSWDVSAQKNI